MPQLPEFPPFARATVIRAAALLAVCAASLAPQASAEVLLTGTSPGENDAAQAFSLSGDSREEVVGGEVRLGDATYRIERVSRLNLIGARREGGSAAAAEFVVFSSSFSDQTATGDPWVAADEYVGCSEPYNSFLAVYRIDAADKRAALTDVPYPDLTTSADASDKATVFCFVSRPPEA